MVKKSNVQNNKKHNKWIWLVISSIGLLIVLTALGAYGLIKNKLAQEDKRNLQRVQSEIADIKSRMKVPSKSIKPN